MTIWDMLRSLVLRWYVTLMAIAVAVAMSSLVTDVKGVYWSRAEVTFLAPTSPLSENALRTTSTTLIVTAAVVARRINGTKTWNQMADPTATIVGEGVLDGWAVRLPDYGGQWSNVYSRQVLDVQVSGPTAELVLERQRALRTQIDATLAELQADVPEWNRITTLVVPDEPTILHVTGRPTRAMAMVWALCGAAAVAASSMLEERARRRRSRG